jgi:DNA-binding NarL/FixJ family response regulator
VLNGIRSNGPLTPREIELLNYAAMGKSNKQIADILKISESTIKNHMSNTLKKLHANDRTHATILAIYRGWIKPNNIFSTL